MSTGAVKAQIEQEKERAYERSYGNGKKHKKIYCRIFGNYDTCFVVGVALTLVHIFGIHFTGTSVNPARALGPAVFARGDALSGLWVFILAPLAGGVLAAVVWKMLQSSSKAIE